MNKLAKPLPIDREINLDPNQTLLSKVSAIGTILYANDYFIEVSGYEEWELMGQSDIVLQHPNIPIVVYKWIQESVQRGENKPALLKSISKDGRYFWTLTHFETKFDSNGVVEAVITRQKAAPQDAVIRIEELYKVLKSIEMKQNPGASEKYFFGFLEEYGLTYDSFILKILNIDAKTLHNYFFPPKVATTTIQEEKPGFFSKYFS